MHLIIDGHSADAQKLQDVSFIYRLLDDFPSQISMTKISPPKVSRYACPKRGSWGISAYVGLAESHISVHTFPEESYVSIDVFSCKEFDSERALADLSERFKLTELRSRVLSRPNLALGVKELDQRQA